MKKIILIMLLLFGCEKPNNEQIITSKFERNQKICIELSNCYTEVFYFFVINNQDTTLVSKLKYDACKVGDNY